MRLAAVFACVILLSWLGILPGHAEKRVALVIGNAAYQSVSALPNPRADAAAIAAALRQVGFQSVTVINDASRKAMIDALSAFGREADNADWAVIYYAGHGIEIGGTNYLIPVNARLASDRDVSAEAVSLNQIMGYVEGARKLRMVLLDACRENPFIAKMARRDASRSVGRGLARVEPEGGTIVAYAAKDGQIAADGSGTNSPFVAALVKHLPTPGVEINKLFRLVRDDVLTATGRKQEPFVYGALPGEDFFFVAPNHDYGFTVKPPPAPAPALTKADVTKLFGVFASALDKIRSDYVEMPDEAKLLRAAIAAMYKAFPQKTSVAAQSPTLPSSDAKSAAPTGSDSSAVYDTALQILNAQRAEGDDQRLVTAAINGMLAELDPQSSYMDAKGFSNSQIQTRGEFGGLGIEVTMQDGLVKVVAPYDDNPAAKAGVMASDIITHLDDLPLQGLTLNQAVEKMRGPEGSTVKLKIMRKGSDQPLEIAITRARIQVRAVRPRLEGDDIGYIRLTTFNEHATENLTKAIGDITTQAGNKLKGFIIDLRNNPGGLLNQAISASDLFLEKGEIVSTRGRKAEATQRFNAKPGDLTKGKPIVVLINGGTAAGSEIVAGALQDHKRATIMGTRSFGRGTVQTIFPLGAGNGALKLTTARYFTPSGRAIQDAGIVPTVEVSQPSPTDQQGKPGSQAFVPPDPKDDKALHAALDVLRGQRQH
jgi:carboxyl-terminal processing protease